MSDRVFRSKSIRVTDKVYGYDFMVDCSVDSEGIVKVYGITPQSEIMKLVTGKKTVEEYLESLVQDRI